MRKSLQDKLVALVLLLAVLAVARPSRVLTQGVQLLYGSFSNSAKAVTVTTNGYMNVSVAGGTVGAANGGTGQNSSAWNALVIVNSGVWGQYTGTTCTNQFPRSLSALGVATCATVSLTADITGVLAGVNGGTGLSTAAIGDLIYASATTPTWSRLADVAAGSYLRSGGANTAPLWSTLVLPNSASAGQYLIATTSNTVIGVLPAWMTAQPANQTGNATATFKMNGLGAAAAPCTITPVATGRVHFVITGSLVQSTTADGVTWKLAEGTGAAPANAAAATGTVISAIGTWTALTGELNVPVTIDGNVSGLTLATAVWFDIQIADVTGGTASLTNVTCNAYEN
jgi:hypothetical protein